MRLFVESWQYECCGKPFAVGQEVEWEVLADPVGDEALAAVGVDAYEERHGGGPTTRVTGRVERIFVLCQEFREEGPMRFPIPGRFRLREVPEPPEDGFAFPGSGAEPLWNETGMVVDLAVTGT